MAPTSTRPGASAEVRLPRAVTETGGGPKGSGDFPWKGDGRMMGEGEARRFNPCPQGEPEGLRGPALPAAEGSGQAWARLSHTRGLCTPQAGD